MSTEPASSAPLSSAHTYMNLWSKQTVHAVRWLCHHDLWLSMRAVRSIMPAGWQVNIDPSNSSQLRLVNTISQHIVRDGDWIIVQAGATDGSIVRFTDNDKFTASYVPCPTIQSGEVL